MEGSHHRRVVHRRRTSASRRLYLTQRTTSSIKRPSRSQGKWSRTGRWGPPHVPLRCNPDGAEIPFDNILDRVTGSDPSVTDYILEQPAKCPNCRREILEKTLIELK